MRWNVVELNQNGLYAKLYRGFLLVKDGERECGRVVIDEMGCLLLSAEQATLSKPLMVRLAEHGIPIVLCGNNYHPIAITLPYNNHHQSHKVLRQQIAASKPLNKRLWQSLVKKKIYHQRQVLINCQTPAKTAINQLQCLRQKTRSGDPDNTEAQAARLYWQALFSKAFRRDQKGDDFVNSALNYGYAIIRAATARAICAAGLNPSLGLHHQNLNNPFCLADDLMEIYRPLVDQQVFSLDHAETLTPGHKQQLAQLLQATIQLDNELTTVNSSMQKLAFSLASSYELKTMVLQIPTMLANTP